MLNNSSKFVLTDGAYDSNTNFIYLRESTITPTIEERRNLIISTKECRVKEQGRFVAFNGFSQVKKVRKYGGRWMAKTVLSSIKRMFGEYVSATKLQSW